MLNESNAATDVQSERNANVGYMRIQSLPLRCKAQKLFIRMKRPTPIAGPMRVAMTIMTKGFAIITLTPH
jgi:hypothetical protein